MQIIKQSTAGVVEFSLFLATNSKDPATGKSPAISLFKNGAAKVAAAGAITELSDGEYKYTPTIADADTLGPMTILVTATGCDPTKIRVQVAPYLPGESVGSVTGNVVGTIGGFSADALAALGGAERGTAVSATATTLVLPPASPFANDDILGWTLLAKSSDTTVWQPRIVNDYVASTKTITVDAWNTALSGTISYILIMTAPASSLSADALNQIVIAKLATMIESAGGGLFRFTVGGVVNAPSGTGSSAAAIRAELDANSTMFQALLAKVTNLPLAPASSSDLMSANITKVNSVTLQGAGTVANPWRPA